MKWLNTVINSGLSVLGLDTIVDLGSLVLLMSIFGTKVAVVYVVVGLIIAVVGGTIIEKLHMENHVEEFIRNAKSSIDIESPDLTVKDRLIYAKEQVAETFKKVFPYILAGVGIGAVIHNWIPENLDSNYSWQQQSFRRYIGCPCGDSHVCGNFYDFIRKNHGMTPGEYRKIHNNF